LLSFKTVSAGGGRHRIYCAKESSNELHWTNMRGDMFTFELKEDWMELDIVPALGDVIAEIDWISCNDDGFQFTRKESDEST